LLKAFVDSEYREKLGLTHDQIPALWFGADARPPTSAAAPAAGRSAVTESQDATLQWPTPLAPEVTLDRASSHQDASNV